MPQNLNRPVRVLHVEDEEAFHELLTLSLEELDCDCDVSWCRDGLEALEWLRSPENTRPDLCFLDLNMPGMDGFGFLRQLRTDDALRELYVVVLTTSSDEKDLLAATRLDVDEDSFIQKPPTFTELVDRMAELRRALAGRVRGAS